ncbi:MULTISPECIES: hypothetical protein [unclassified Caballeronia]|nr:MULTISPECIES: hypothetical protein [unclassified Caballeronia]
MSHYDPIAFCRAIKDGVDPADIVLRRAMPRYKIADAQCAALWQFVMSR